MERFKNKVPTKIKEYNDMKFPLIVDTIKISLNIAFFKMVVK